MRKIVVLILFFGLFIGCDKSDQIKDVLPEEEPSIKNATLIVPDDYLTIQEAVNAAPNGCTITIRKGTYPELVIIHYKNDITLIGENATLCPPDGIINGEGSFNIDIFGSSNIRILNLKFDGKVEGKTYPIDRAIAFTFSSGEASNNKIDGYSTGIACFNLFEDPYPGPGQNGDMLSIKISKNNFSGWNGGGVGIIGNFNVEINKNIINNSFDPNITFYSKFLSWHGMTLHGGTGIISNNIIKFKTGSGSVYLHNIMAIQLLMRNPAPHLYGMMHYLHDVDVIDNIMKGTEVGIAVNDDVPLYPVQTPPEEWCVHDVSLLYNKFIQVENNYAIYNECEIIQILPIP